MTREEKALLDMIAYSEGTLGVSNNGYDVLVGNKRLIAGWSKDTTIPHGGSDWAITITTKNGSVKTSAAGRYQFLYSTWIGSNKVNLPMTIDNQNKKGLELINYALRGTNIDKTQLANNRNLFNIALSKLSTQWASLPNLSGQSTYAGDGVNGVTASADKAFQIYLTALSKY